MQGKPHYVTVPLDGGKPFMRRFPPRPARALLLLFAGAAGLALRLALRAR